VTTIQHSPFHQHLVAVGSYDESLCLWDLRNMKHPIFKKNMESGVWRIKWHPTIPSLILAACMRSGFKVLRTNLEFNHGEDSQIATNMMLTYRGQCESLAYGTDWCYNPSFCSESSAMIATCSFYDRCLGLWNPSFQK